MTAAPTPNTSVRSSAVCSPPPTWSQGVPSSSAWSVDVGAPLFGEGEEPAAAGLLGADEALVLQLRERGIDRARAGAPGAAAAVLDLLHEPVAVARLLAEQDEQGGADVAAPGAGAEAAGPERRAAEAAAVVGPAATAAPVATRWPVIASQKARGSN